MTLDDSGLVRTRWPALTAELVTALHDADEEELVHQVADLRVVKECDCGDSFCQSFSTRPEPDGAYGPGHRNVGLSPERPGMLILDVVDGVIMYVEVIDRPPLT